MNKHDIEELQSFLQGDYIEESTSRSLKEVKQYQQTQKEITSKNKLNEIRKFLRKYLFKKTIRQLEQYQLHINKKDLRTDRERELYDFICNDLRSCETDLVAAKNKICDYLGIDKNMHEFSQASFDIRQQVDANRIILDLKRIYGREIRRISSGIHLIHLTRSSKLTSLKPSTKNQEINRVYAEPCVFFFAIKASNTKDAIKKLMSTEYESIIPKSVRAAYEYIPKGNTEVFLDSTHLSDKQMKTLSDFDTVTPVFIKTRTPLPVKDVTSIYRDEFNKAMGESYIDETIERFDAFMEEFNLTHNEYIQEIKPTIEPEKPLTETEKRLTEIRDRMVWHTRQLSYSEYSKLRDEFSRLTGYPRDAVINPGFQQLTGNVHGWNLSKFQGNKRPKKVNVPPGTHFFHNSPNPNLVVSLKHFYSDDRMTSMFGVEYPEILYPYPRLYFYKDHVGGNATGRMGEKVKSYDKNGMPIFDEKLKNGKSHCYMYISKPGDEFFRDPEMDDSEIAFLKLTKPIKLIKIY